MSLRDRFERLEKERQARGDSAPVRPTATEGRFGSLLEPRPESGREHDRVGGELARFEPAPVASDEIRVLETGDACFVRCAECRFDNFLTATRCRNCQADLTSAAQRSYSEAFWTRRAEEKAEEERELEDLRQRRAEADRQAADAMRQLIELEQQWAARQALGMPWDEGHGIVRLAREGGRRYGLVIGGWAFRLFPNRAHRIAFFVALAAGFVGLALTLLPGPLVAVILGLTGISLLFRWLGSRSRGRG
jgi:hypothetical protein